MKTEYRTAMDLRPYGYENPITEEGRYNPTPYSWTKYYWEINHSSILTRLIQEAGRYCERFASDLFIDWSIVEDTLRSSASPTNTLFFGFRENGVDGESFIDSRMQSDMYHHEYRSIWRLDIRLEPDEEHFTMKLYRVD